MRNRPDDENKKRRRANETALSYGVKLLSVRPYSERKLKEKLVQRAFAADEISAALKRLREERFLDDRRYAEDFVRARLASRPRTGPALIRDLLQRGVAMPIAGEVAKKLTPPESQLDLARELIRRKAAQYAHVDEQTRRRRLTGLLARRGFSFSIIQQALKLDLSAED
jgi:regulatory protein